MGLSVCYEFRANIDADAARDVVQQLHDIAVTLPFQQVLDVTEITASSTDDETDPEDRHFLMLFGTQYGRKERSGGDDVWIEIPPKHVIGFAIRVAEGAETAQIGLATHPAVVEKELAGRTEIIETGLAGIYSWAQCCKTQYAGLQQYGGPDNFLKAHLALIELLDRAGELGLQVQVHDDSGYWDDRDEPRLLQQLQDWNGLIAAFAGQLKDRLGTGQNGLQAPILTAPDFEHLEAKGLSQWSEPPAEDA
jgi:hypothetical protein